MHFKNLNDVYSGHQPVKDVHGLVLPFQGGRFRLTEEYNVFDTGIVDKYPNPTNGFMAYLPNMRVVGPEKLYERNKSISIKSAAFVIPDIGPNPLNVVYLYLLAHKPIAAPDSVLTSPNFKVSFTKTDSINKGELNADEMDWMVSGPVTFTAYNGRDYRLSPTPANVAIDDVTGAFYQMRDGSRMVEGTNRKSLLFDCGNGKLAEDMRAKVVACSLGLTSVSKDVEYVFRDQDITNMNKHNIVQAPRKDDASTMASTGTDYDFVYHDNDPAPSTPSGKPVPNFTYVADELELTFTDASVDNGSITQWLWDMGEGTTYTTQNPVHTFTEPGLYRVTLRVTDNESNASYKFGKTIEVRRNLKPVAEFSTTINYLEVTCNEMSEDVDGTIVAYAWDFGDGNSSTIQNPVHTYGAAGEYDITLEVTDDKGNVSSAYRQTVSVVANTPPTASFTVDSQHFLEVSCTSTVEDAENAVTAYQWDMGDGNSYTTANVSHEYASAGTYTISLTVTDMDGLDSTPVTQDVTVIANSVPVASFTETVDHLKVNFQDTSTDADGNATIVAWDWDLGDGFTSTLKNPSVEYLTAGVKTITLTVTDQEGATSTQTSRNITLVANVPPTASFTSTETFLEAQFTNTSTDGDGTIDTYAWDFGDGNTSVQESTSHTYAAAGTYDVTLTVTDDDGGSDTETAQITVVANVPPTASFTSTQSFLVSNFTDTSTDGDGSINQYAWNFGDGNTSGLQNPSHTYAAAGTYDVSLVVTDDQGAQSVAATEQVTVVANVAPTADFTYTVDHNVVTFTNTSTDGDGSITTNEWFFSEGLTSSTTNPVVTFTDDSSLVKTASLRVTDDQGVTGEKTVVDINITFNQKPVANFTHTVDKLEVTFNDTSADTDGTISAWNWDFGDGNTSTQQNPVHTFAGAGAQTVTLTVTDEDGLDSDPVVVTVTTVANVPPTSDFSWVQGAGSTVDFTQNASDGDGSIAGYAWDFGGGNTSTDPNPSFDFTTPGTYSVTLVVTDDNGGTGTDTQSVVVV